MPEWRVLLNPDTYEGQDGFSIRVADMTPDERAVGAETFRKNVAVFYAQAVADEGECTDSLLQFLFAQLGIPMICETHPYAWLHSMPLYRALTAQHPEERPEPGEEWWQREGLPGDPFNPCGNTHGPADHRHHGAHEDWP